MKKLRNIILSLGLVLGSSLLAAGQGDNKSDFTKEYLEQLTERERIQAQEEREWQEHLLYLKTIDNLIDQ